MDQDKSVDTSELTIFEKLYSETAQIAWHELQRFFAQGVVLNVDPNLNLIEVAVMFADDQADQLEPLIANQQVAAPDNDVARQWYDDDAVLWSVVVAPYVLVQDKEKLK